jgi:outer membrane protein assembly factor BamB
MKRSMSYAIGLMVLFVAASAQAQRLVLVSASYGKNILAICDAKGEVLWSHKTAGGARGHSGHHEVQMLSNGNILFHDDWNTVKEMQLDGKVVWSYKSSNVHAFTRLANGSTMIAESGTGRIIVVDKDGKLVSETPLGKDGRASTRQAEVLANGNYLVCAERPGAVTEYNAKGDIVWEYLIKTRVYGAIRLKNGNTLIASGSGNSVVEVTPDKKVVWEIKGNVPETEVQLKWTTCLQELDNGNLIVGNCHAGPDNPQIFEIDRDKKIVWQFDEFDLVGNGLACWQVLEGDQAAAVRKQLAELDK